MNNLIYYNSTGGYRFPSLMAEQCPALIAMLAWPIAYWIVGLPIPANAYIVLKPMLTLLNAESSAGRE